MVVQVAALRAAIRGTICASRLGIVGSAKPLATPKKNIDTKITDNLTQPSVKTDALIPKPHNHWRL
jgi:hypothetical protein